MPRTPQCKRARTNTPHSNASCGSDGEVVPDSTAKLFKRLSGEKLTSSAKKQNPIALVAILLTQSEKAFGAAFSKQTHVDILQLAAAAQDLLNKRETVNLEREERRGLNGFVYEVAFFAYAHIHYERAHEQYVGSSRCSFAFGWFLLCICIRSLILPAPDAPGFLGAQPGPPGSKDRCYDEKAARILACLVVTVICANDPAVKGLPGDLIENSNGNKEGVQKADGEMSETSSAAKELPPSEEKEIAKQILGSLEGSMSFYLRRRFLDLLDEKFDRTCDTTWSLKPWVVNQLEKSLSSNISQIDLWLVNGTWDVKVFWTLIHPLKQKFARAPLEWHFIPTRSLVPLSYQGPVLLPHEEARSDHVRREPTKPLEATILPIANWLGDSPSMLSNQEPCEVYKAKPVAELNVHGRENMLESWIDEVHAYPSIFPSLPQKRKRGDAGKDPAAELNKYILLFQKPLGLSNCEMKPIKQLFLKVQEVIGSANVAKNDIPYILLMCTEAWCLVSEIFPSTAPPESVIGEMAQLRRSLLSHRIVFFELLLALKLDEVRYWEILSERLHPCASFLPRRVVLHLEDSLDELICRTVWLSGSSIFTQIARFENLRARKAKVSKDLEHVDKVFHAVLRRGGKVVLDVAELHSIPYTVRYAAFDILRHCIVRLPDLLKDRHLDTLAMCSLQVAAKIFREEYIKLVVLSDTCAALRPHLSQLWHQTVWRNVPLVCKPFQFHHLSLKQSPSEYGDITEFHNTVFSVASRTMCCALTKLAHPNSHMRPIQDVAIEVSMLAPYTAGRMTRTAPLKMTKSLLARYRQILPVSQDCLTDACSLQGEVLGALGTLPFCQLPDVLGIVQRTNVTNFHWLPGLIYTLDHITRRYRIVKCP